MRRSVASGLGTRRAAARHREILNHRSGFRGGVSGTYNRSPYEREVKQALAMWSDHVAAITEGSKRKLIAFDRRKI